MIDVFFNINEKFQGWRVRVEDDDGRDMDGEDGKFVWAGG